MAKTFWKGNPSRPVRQSRAVTAYGPKLWPAERAAEYEAKFEKARREGNLPIPGEWLVDTRLKSELPKLGLCKIRTDRIREMTLQQLERTQFFVGPVTMRDRMSRTNPRGLLHRFVSNLIGERTQEDLTARSAEAYRKTYGEDPKPSSEIRESYRKEASRVEREIWDAQQKKKCPIADRDAPARDYIKSTDNPDPAFVNKIRGRRKPIIR